MVYNILSLYKYNIGNINLIILWTYVNTIRPNLVEYDFVSKYLLSNKTIKSA